MISILIIFSLKNSEAQCNFDAVWEFTNATCPNNPNGKICCLGLIGGTALFTCSISPNAGVYNAGPPECFNNLPTGTYIITTTDANGCFVLGTYIVGSANPVLTASFTKT